MKTSIFATALLLAAFLSAACTEKMASGSGQTAPSPAMSPAMSEADVSRTLIKLEEDGAKAMVSGDASYVEKYMGDNWVWTLSSGDEVSKSALLSDLKAGKYKFTGATASDMKVKVYGNFAIVTGTIALKGSYDGHDIGGSERFTDTWYDNKGTWVMAATHNSPAPKPAGKKM